MQLCCLKCTGILDKTNIEDVTRTSGQGAKQSGAGRPPEDSIEVDFCRDCGGLWLDQGELERIARLAQKSPEALSELRRKLIPLPTATPEPSDISASCPVCSRASMREVVLGDLHIDYCTICKGVYLDKGELDAALERVSLPGTRLSMLIAVATRELRAAA